jgi:hypothetical protein
LPDIAIGLDPRVVCLETAREADPMFYVIHGAVFVPLIGITDAQNKKDAG